MTPEECKYISDFYRDNYGKLFAHAYAIMGRRDYAEVAVQEAFGIACQKIDKLKASNSAVGWMKKTTENVALHILREQRRDQKLFLFLEDADTESRMTNLKKSTWEIKSYCLKAVSEEELIFFLRIAEAGFSYIEEAERLGISRAACYKRFERIRTKLQKALQHYEE